VTVESTRANGNMESNTEKASFTIPKQKYGKTEFGVMDAECNGITLLLHRPILKL